MGVYQRTSDGRWCAVVTLPGGRRVVKYAATRKDGVRLRDQMVRDLHLHTLVSSARLTLDAWVDRWLTQKARRPHTLYTYRATLQPYRVRLGRVRLTALTTEQVGWAIRDMQGRGVGSSTVQHGYKVLRACLRAAVRQRLLGHNPTDYLDPPVHTTGPRQALTLDQTTRFIAAATQSTLTHAPLVLFILGTGLRTAEVTGLTWGDLDLDSGQLTVRQTQVEVAGQHHPSSPKTEAGSRTLVLTGAARRALQGKTRGSPDSRVFTSQTGTVPYQRNLLRTLRTLCREAGVPAVSPHDLRRTHASLMAGAGVDVATLQRRLGHTRASVTLDVYTRPVHPDQKAAQAFDHLFS